jgi:hypothetical protein
MWHRAKFLVMGDRFFDVLHPRLNLQFEFDQATGKISPISGTGSSNGGTKNSSHAYIGFDFQIDNSGEVEHTVTIEVHMLATVLGSVTTGHRNSVTAGGKVEPKGSGGNVSGTFMTTYSNTTSDGGAAHDTQHEFVLKVRAKED